MFITAVLLEISVKIYLHVCLLWQNLHHPGVVNLQDMFETSVKVYVILNSTAG